MSSLARRRLAPPALLVLLLAATAAVVGVAPQASAACYQHTALPITYSHSGYVRAREGVQYPSTCDRDSVYKGLLQDSVTDRSCAWAQVWDEPVKSTPVTACTTGAWVGFTYWDQQGNSNALMRLCYGGGCSAYYWFNTF